MIFVGFNSSFNELEQLIWLLAEMKEIQLFVIVFKHGDRFNPELARWIDYQINFKWFCSWTHVAYIKNIFYVAP